MEGRTGTEVWRSAAWRAEAVGWLDQRLAELGRARLAAVDQPHLRSWSTILRASTSDGDVWLKAEGPGQAFEVALYEVLTRHVPRHVLTPLAADHERAWLLLPDGGPLLGSVVADDDLVDVLCAVLPQYADLQLDLAHHVDELSAAGVVDMRPQTMPERFDQALAAAHDLAQRTGGSDHSETLARLTAARPRFGRWCAELAAGPIRPTLQHDDLHPWNMFAVGHASSVTFFDWGDSVVGHPFATLLVTLRTLREGLLTSSDDARVRRVRDAYLEPFGHLGDREELLEMAELACHVGKVTRALQWFRELRLMTPAEAADAADAPLRWLAEVLADDCLGSYVRAR